MTTATFNPQKLELTDGDFIGSEFFEEMILDHEGSFYQDDNYMVFEANGFEVTVTFNLCVDGYTTYDAGDYFTPPCSFIEVGSVDIDVTRVEIDEFEVELTNELVKAFEKKIDELI